MKNVILITVDCLRPDHLGCYGYKGNTSPNIDKLATKGIRYTQAISNGGQTPFSFPSIMASLLPPIKVEEVKYGISFFPTLAESFWNRGYYTVGIRDNPFLYDFFGYGRGFVVSQDFKMKSSIKIPTKIRTLLNPIVEYIRPKPYADATKLTSEAIRLCKGKNPFFLWIHYMDCHVPYLPPKKYCSISVKDAMKLYKLQRKEPIAYLYDSCIKYVDNEISRLLSELGDAQVIVTADHGEALGEHRQFSHWSLYDEVLRVPLIISGAGIKSGEVINTQVELRNLNYLIDGQLRDNNGVISTMLYSPDGGESLEYLFKPDSKVQRLISYRTPEWKYIVKEDAGGKVISEETYLLADDPSELVNFHGEDESSIFEETAKAKIQKFKVLK